MSKSYFIKTYGCQMNVNDSEIMAGLLERAGYEESLTAERSDIILINTCCIRQRAEDKAFGYALQMIKPKMKNPDRLIGICGCIAEKDKEKLFKKLPFLSFVVGPGQEGTIVEVIESIRSGKDKVLSLGYECANFPSQAAKRKPATQAFVTIMTGCDNFCSYCIVPYVRGREASRPASEILDEIRELDRSIFKEVILLGQNVNSYRDSRCEMRDVNSSRTSRLASHESYRLNKLLEDVHEIDGIKRIRFLTSHPRDMSDEIIDAVRDLPKVCGYFHLPLQSGDNDILKAMNRGYTADYYRKLVEKIRSKIPDATITSDAIAGFPGETEEQFNNTIKLIKELELDLVNTLVYSVRPGTAAEKIAGHISDNVKSERLSRLMEVVEASALKRNIAMEGTCQEILVDRASKDLMAGRTKGNKVVTFKGGKELIGSLVKVKIIKASAWGLNAQI